VQGDIRDHATVHELFLGEVPDQLDPLRIGQNAKETLDCDLAAEMEAIKLYKEARAYCNSVGDYVSQKLFEDLLMDEEGHVDFLETQIELFENLGAEKYAQLNALPMDEAE
jgi:bacterioferritin